MKRLEDLDPNNPAEIKREIDEVMQEIRAMLDLLKELQGMLWRALKLK